MRNFGRKYFLLFQLQGIAALGNSNGIAGLGNTNCIAALGVAPPGLVQSCLCLSAWKEATCTIYNLPFIFYIFPFTICHFYSFRVLHGDLLQSFDPLSERLGARQRFPDFAWIDLNRS